MKKFILLAISLLQVVALPMWAQNDPTLSVELQKKLENYQKQLAVYDAQIEALSLEAKAEPSRLIELRDKAMGLYDEKIKTELGIIRENSDNMIPAFFIKDVVYSLEYHELVEICNPKNAYYNHAVMELPKKLLVNLEKRAPGKMYKDMNIKDMDGVEHQLSEWIGKGQYVLIDFWASWCGPCRQEMPNVVANYEKYHDKGFEIIGISFDQKAEQWKQAVKQMNMSWPQLSDLGGWQSAAVDTYGVSSIPASILIDGKGIIVATDLRGEKLGARLKELYGF